MTHTTPETVTTWADASGIWHARVTFPAPGYGPAYLDAHIDRIRAKARRAIRREIASRQADQTFTVRVEVKTSHLDSLNHMTSITYGERS